MSRPIIRQTHNTSHDDSHHNFLRLPGPSLDFRDEQIYLKGIAPYVHLTRPSQKGKEKEGSSQPGEVITIEWRKVMWITTRDHVLMPLIRGLVWGVAGHYVARITSNLVGSKGQSRPSRPHKEGLGVGWLRKWLSSLTSGVRTSATAGPSRGF